MGNLPKPAVSLDRLIEQPDDLARRARAALDGARAQGAYLHVPFCFHKCHYCDFYSIADSQDRQEAFVDRLMAEMDAASRHGIFQDRLATIFVGGGTPTLLTADQWQRLLGMMSDRLPLADDGEFTVEMNPETVTADLMAVLRAGGVNRASIGAQSFDARHLKTLERWHDPRNVDRSLSILRDAGIGNINLDLIFGVPGQTLDDWRRDLDEALALRPTHISCYGLMYEPNTPLTRRMQAGDVTPVTEDVEAAMYEATIERLAQAGFEHYEISNWARDGVLRCRHNLLYWRNGNWWAFGPSASGHVNGLRWKNVPRLGDYLEAGPAIALPPVVDVEMVDAATAAGEEFMMGLRLIDGLAMCDVERLLGLSGSHESARRAAIERHCGSGLLQASDNRLRLTRRGLLLANHVLVDLV